ncbi:sushi domain-containing protein 3 [Synchiropus picturatus]
MSAATAPVADVPRGDLIRNNSWERSNASHPQNQCSPFPLPALGTQRIIQGNGTNVGTVISLQCPAMHKLVGSQLKCVMTSNTTAWVGAPFCKPLLSDFGFRVAVVASIVSSGIILFMSLVFITCCWLDCLKESDRKQKERELDLWQSEECPLHQEDVKRPRQGHRGRNNNNNCQLSLWDAHDPVFCDSVPNCRYEPPPPRSLPGLERGQPLIPQNSTSNFRPPPSCYQTPGGGHVSAGRGAVWQYEQGRVSGAGRAGVRNKECSIRIISV